MYADIIVDISQEQLDKTFQYRIPPELENEVQIDVYKRQGKDNGCKEKYFLCRKEKADNQSKTAGGKPAAG